MKRLETISNYIFPYKNIADIGCDHGYLIKIAFERGLINFAYAIDNKEGPLEQAKKTLYKYNNVSYFLSDGLDKVDENIECVVIAGMGGNLIKDIISTNVNKTSFIKRFIIEANKDEYKIREYLTSIGYKIVSETIVYEDDKYYEIDVFDKSKNNITYTFNELYFGPILIKDKPKDFIDKWTAKYNVYKDIEAYYTDIEKNKILEGIKEILC